MYDVCLMLEGTYPFVSGGVSTWVHHLVKALPELLFTGICILPTSKEKWERKYDLPDNFRDLRVVYLHDYELTPQARVKQKKRSQQIELLRTFHQGIKGKKYSLFADILPFFQSSKKEAYLPYDMIYGKDAWDLLLEFYGPEKNRESFIDYFWTFRFTHLPIFKVLSTDIPMAKVYHTVSTGYAGILGAEAKDLYGKPLLLTEHGIYTKERKIEIAQSEWVYVADADQIKLKKELGAFQKIWIQLFDSLGRITYQEADRIYTLYEGNRELELAGGANPDKVFVIPNGVDINRFSSLKPVDSGDEWDEKGVFNVGFVGRVVPIKDVKTLLRAVKIVSLRLPNVKFHVMGPTDENPEYYKECLELMDVLRLQSHLEFTGKVNVMDYYPILHLLVLTSISEAQPLVILEANCAGIPVVASDVGACRELLEGRTEQDRALGPSGIVTQVADPVSTAEGIISILSNRELRKEMALSGRKRVKKFYRESDLNREYLSVYRELMGGETSGHEAIDGRHRL